MKPHIIAIYTIVVIMLGSVAGLVCWLFFFLMDTCLHFLWNTLPQTLGIDSHSALNGLDGWWWPLPLCLFGGLLVGLLQKRYLGLPKEMNEVMAQVKQTGRYEYSNLPANFLCALIPLIFGGSIGPEAGLTGVIAGLCTWVGDRLRFLGREFQELASAGIAAILSAVFDAPLYGLAVPTMDNGESVAGMKPIASRPVKVVVYVAAVASSLGTMAVLKHLLGGGSGLPHFEGIQAGSSEWLLVLPLALSGTLLGWICHFSGKAARLTSNRIGNRPVVKALLAGLLLGIVGCVLPFTMFAGETQAETIQNTWALVGVTGLLLTALVKPIVLQFCLNLGWHGGMFFPMIFSGIALGYAAAGITGADPIFCLCICTAATMGAVMRQPILAALLLVMCFPVQAVLPMLLAAGIGSVIPLPKGIGKEAPETA